MCGGLILSCCPRNPHGHERALKEEEVGKCLENTVLGTTIFWKKVNHRCTQLKSKSRAASAATFRVKCINVDPNLIADQHNFRGIYLQIGEEN